MSYKRASLLAFEPFRISDPANRDPLRPSRKTCTHVHSSANSQRKLHLCGDQDEGPFMGIDAPLPLTSHWTRRCTAS